MSSASARRAVQGEVLSSFRGKGRELRSLVAWSLVEALPAFLSGRLIAQAIDDGFLAGRTRIGFLWLAILGASALVGAWGTRQTFRRLAGLVEPFRDRLVERAVTGALRRSTVASAPADTDGVARLTQQVEIVREAYASVLLTVQTFLVTSVSALIGLLTLVPAVLVLVLPPLVLGLGLFFCALGRMAARQRVSILADERIAGAVSTVAGGLRDVVACGAEDSVAATVGERIEAQARATREVARFTAFRTVSVAVGGWLPVLLVLVAAPWLLRQGASTGALLGAVTYLLGGVHPALQTLVRGLGGPGLWLVVTLRRILETGGVEESTGETRAPGASPAIRQNDLRLSGVTFSYGSSAEPVIHALDLVVPEGDHLAVVGPSGVGKSTLANLIAGMLEPQAGDVRLGGVRVGELDVRAAARHRVLIPQEAYVFAGTLWENLVYLRGDVTPAAVDDAVGGLGLRPLVERLGGYGAEVDVAQLSAGERQLITLVRAYLSPARLVILDEATCHLDPAAEARVERAFVHRPGTLIVIAHRMSSALRARRVLVLDGSRVHLGTHDDLLERSELYRDLVGRWEWEAPPPPPAAPGVREPAPGSVDPLSSR